MTQLKFNNNPYPYRNPLELSKQQIFDLAHGCKLRFDDGPNAILEVSDHKSYVHLSVKEQKQLLFLLLQKFGMVAAIDLGASE